MTDRWLLWIDTIYLITIIFLFVSILLLRLTLDRRIRKSLPENRVYNSLPDWYGGFMRAMGFGYAVVFDRINTVGMKEFYDGIDVQKFVNIFEKITAYVFVISSAIFILGMIFYSIISFTGSIK